MHPVRCLTYVTHDPQLDKNKYAFNRQVKAIAIHTSPVGELAVAVRAGCAVYVFYDTESIPRQTIVVSDDMRHIRFGSLSKLAITCTTSFAIWDLDSGDRITTVEFGDPVYTGVFALDASLFCVVTEGSVVSYNIATKTSVKATVAGCFHICACSPDGKSLLVARTKNRPAIVDSVTLGNICLLPNHDHDVRAACIMDNVRAAVIDSTITVIIGNIITGVRLQVLALTDVISNLTCVPNVSVYNVSLFYMQHSQDLILVTMYSSFAVDIKSRDQVRVLSPITLHSAVSPNGEWYAESDDHCDNDYVISVVTPKQYRRRRASLVLMLCARRRRIRAPPPELLEWIYHEFMS